MASNKLPLTDTQLIIRTASAVFLLCSGLLPDDSVRPLQLFGWLIWIHLLNRIPFRSGLILSLATGLILSLAGTFWIEYFGARFIFKALLLSVWILPVFYCLKILLSRIPGFSNPLAWMSAWILTGFWIFRTPVMQGFFNFPLILEQILWLWPAWGLLILSTAWIGLVAGISDFTGRQTRFLTLFCAFVLTAASIYGLVRMSGGPVKPLGIKAALVQHNVPFYPKSEDLKKVLADYAAAAAAEKPGFIFFPLFDLPESLQRDLVDSENGFFSDLAKRTGASILAASKVSETVLTGQFSSRFQILAALRASDGRLAGLHQSTMRSFFHDSRQNLASEYRLIGNIGVLICYELDHSGAAGKARRLGADFLVGLSNPGDAAYSPLPAYHLREIQRRAIEAGLPILTVTPNGFTAWIDSRGRILAKSSRNQNSILFAEI